MSSLQISLSEEASIPLLQIFEFTPEITPVSHISNPITFVNSDADLFQLCFSQSVHKFANYTKLQILADQRKANLPTTT